MLCPCIAAAVRSTQTILDIIVVLLLLVFVVEAERPLGLPKSFLNDCYDCVHRRKIGGDLEGLKNLYLN